MKRLFDRHADEFTASMTAVVKLPTAGGDQETRIFSLRGCHLLAMLSRTKIAKTFRAWVLDILDKEVGQEAKAADLEAVKQAPSDSRIRQALGLSTIVGATTNTLVFNQVLQSETSLFRLRLLVGVGSDMTPYAIPLDDDACVVSLSRLAEMIVEPGGIMPSNTELANLAKACTTRLAQRMEYQAQKAA
jgi:hypothetical protein